MQVVHALFALIEPNVIENVRINLAQKVDEFDATFVVPVRAEPPPDPVWQSIEICHFTLPCRALWTGIRASGLAVCGNSHMRNLGAMVDHPSRREKMTRRLV